jgi:hypothetical protein
MSTDPAARGRAMGLVKAAYASWISTSPSMSGKDKQHQDYVARCKDLKALGLQATESERGAVCWRGETRSTAGEARLVRLLERRDSLGCWGGGTR